MRLFGFYLLVLSIALGSISVSLENAEADERETKRLVYLVSDSRIPFWDIMWRGARNKAEALGYEIDVLSADNDRKTELKNTVQAIKLAYDGIIVSPTNSSACVTVLNLAAKAGIPVVISDIGTEGGEYVSYIASNNEKGAYEIGGILAEHLNTQDGTEGSVGIIGIPQSRANGQARTKGFLRAMDEAGIRGAGLFQQESFSHEETREFAERLISENEDLIAIWLQGSNRYQGALEAIEAAGKDGEIALLTFDAEPEFMDLIPQKVLVGAAMQQPFMMGETAVDLLDQHLRGMSVPKEHLMDVLAVSSSNIEEKLPLIKRNVLGILEAR